MTARVTLHLCARLEERQAAESALRSLCHGAGQSERYLDELLSAFIEAFNNVVLHAYRDQPGGMVDVVLQLDDNQALIELSDSGRSFDMQAVPPPAASSEDSGNLTEHGAPDERLIRRLGEGGYGVHIIRSLMSEVSYSRVGGRNVLRMIKHFAAIPATSATDDGSGVVRAVAR